MHCASCPIMIDGKLEDEVDGVVRAETHYAQQLCEVEYDENKTHEKAILNAIQNIGYAAEII